MGRSSEILATKINFLGDSVSFLPTLKGLLELMPGARLTVVCSPVGKQVFSGSLPEAEIIVVDYSRVRSVTGMMSELFRVLNQLRGRRFDMSLHAYDDPSFVYVLGALLRIPRRIGFASNIAKGQRLLTERLPFSPERNTVEINYDLVRYVTGRQALNPFRVPIRYSQEDCHVVEQRLAHIGLREDSRFVAIHPGAKLPYKEWGLSNFLALASAIESELGCPVVIISEIALANSSRHRVVSGISIPQLAYLLEKASLFVGNNSGPMHVAAAMGTPCVVIQGPSPSSWEIAWDDVRCVVVKASQLPCMPCERLGYVPGRCLNTQRPNACMKEVTVEQVLNAVASVLEGVGLKEAVCGLAISMGKAGFVLAEGRGGRACSTDGPSDGCAEYLLVR